MQRAEDTIKLQADLERRTCRDIKQFFREGFDAVPPDLEHAGRLLIKAGYQPTPMPRASYIRKNYDVPSSLQSPHPERWTGRVFLLGTFYNAMGHDFELSPDHQATLAADYGLALSEYTRIHPGQPTAFHSQGLAILEAVLDSIDEIPPAGLSAEAMGELIEAPRAEASHLEISAIHDAVCEFQIREATLLPIGEQGEPLGRARYHRSRSLAHAHNSQALQYLGVAHIQVLLARHAFHTNNPNAGQRHIESFVHYFLKDALTTFGAESFTLFSSDLNGAQDEYDRFVDRAKEVITLATAITHDPVIPQDIKDYCLEEFTGLRTLLPARDVDLGALARELDENALPATPETRSKLDDLRRLAPPIDTNVTDRRITKPLPPLTRQKRRGR